MGRNVGIDLKYSAFKYKTSFQSFPVQEPAFRHFDHILEKLNEDKINKNEVKYNDDKKASSLLWSIEPRLFAAEDATSGKRKYIAAHLGRFLHHYWRFSCPSSRHYYELIREGEPCRLYFDLEYNKLSNPSIDTATNEILLNEFIEELKIELNTIYNLSIEKTNIIDLESSTVKKFSRHFIIHFPNGELFSDAVSCGIFVKQFVGRLATEQSTGELIKKKRHVLSRHLFVQTGESSRNDENIENGATKSNTCCFVDTGVYTRNRVFRLLGSTKYGKTSSAMLRSASTNQYPFPEKFSNSALYDPEEQGEEAGEGTMKKGTALNETKVTEQGWEEYASVLADTFIVPVKVKNENKPIILPKIAPDELGETRLAYKPSLLSKSNYTNSSHGREIPSPIPVLDGFINNVLGKRKGIHGSFRSWIIDSKQLSNCTITYNMKDNRWCENINRCHKSNNIKWVVSIPRMQYWQTCHDPECRSLSFRGKVNNLPPEIEKGIQEVLYEKTLEIDEDFAKALANLSTPGPKNGVEEENENDISFGIDEDIAEVMRTLKL